MPVDAFAVFAFDFLRVVVEAAANDDADDRVALLLGLRVVLVLVLVLVFLSFLFKEDDDADDTLDDRRVTEDLLRVALTLTEPLAALFVPTPAPCVC